MRVFMLGLAVWIAAVAPTTSFADDQQIADFIKAKLLEEKQRGNLFGFNVDMRVDQGTVWFEGFVSNRSQEMMILRTAQLAGHLGVVQVVDDIEINTSFAESAKPVEVVAPQRQTMPSSVMVNSQMETPAQPPVATNQDTNAQRVAYQEAVPNYGLNQPQGYPQGYPQQQPYARAPQTPYGVQSPIPAYTQPTFQQNVLSPIQPQQPQQQYARPQAIAPPQPVGLPTASTNGIPLRNVGAAVGQPLPFARSTAGPAAGPNAPLASGGFNVGGGSGIANDSANLPGYAWPAYASHPNYGAVSYPKQYSPSAWPYIGPFYPYPQVPLGWRKVSLEWDDGWWFLDCDDKN